MKRVAMIKEENKYQLSLNSIQQKEIVSMKKEIEEAKDFNFNDKLKQEYQECFKKLMDENEKNTELSKEIDKINSDKMELMQKMSTIETSLHKYKERYNEVKNHLVMVNKKHSENAKVLLKAINDTTNMNTTLGRNTEKSSSKKISSSTGSECVGSNLSSTNDEEYGECVTRIKQEVDLSVVKQEPMI